MSQHTHRPILDQVELLSRQFAQAPGLPFGDVLSAAAVEDAFRAEHVHGYDCVYRIIGSRAFVWASARRSQGRLRARTIPI